ncbi:SulP family inorganic anion transporter [Methylocella tundrae]|uniref:SulP family inorganic anion transporter n=1 Tax=Methylocella tundrae TaxID=227605 RepID=A0A4U8Z4J5_METTU|nr:SulP family inorganic anion transporter [Methylocella tundrae]WPP04133.1 SulP family inorganic anion transporter [Methylocella tundrae]VFU10394.1 SulP family inorganic anion transporter [Methylocella tundrae]
MRAFFARRSFADDLLASVVVFLVALPLCMGIAIASGMSAASGLITGIVGGLVVGFLAGSPLQVSGPAAGLAVLVFELVRTHGVAALGPVVLLAGLIQIGAGLFRVGVWFRMTSPAVVYGMLAGIGILIVASQLHVLVDAAPRASGLDNLLAIPEALLGAGAGDGLIAGSLGLATIGLMLAWEKLRPAALRALPGALIAVVIIAGLAQALSLDVKYVDIPANLFDSAQFVSLSTLAFWLDPKIIVTALAFAFIASAETLLSAAAVDRMHDGPRTQYDRELAAQGVGNAICGALGALPMTGVIVRSAANVQAGAKTRASAILHGAWILAFALLAPGLLRSIPVSCLAGILVYTGFKMLSPAHLRQLRAYGYGAMGVYAATAIAIVATDLLTGVLVGFALSLFRLSLRSAALDVRLVDSPKPGEARLHLDGAATFLKAPALANALDKVPADTVLHVVIDRLTHIDHAALELLRDWGKNAGARGCALVVDWPALQSRTEGARQAA